VGSHTAQDGKRYGVDGSDNHFTLRSSIICGFKPIAPSLGTGYARPQLDTFGGEGFCAV
jgi:hypothetical protein